MFSLDIMSSIRDSLRVLMLEICNIVYRLISFCFSIFESLGTAEIITNDKVQAIFSRVSLILGLFMVFRITFAFIEYIIDPDAMSDKKKGAGAIVKKVIIVIVLLGSTSSLFKLAFQAQDIIVNNDIVSKVIFGTKNTDKEKFGSELSYEVFSAFYRMNDNDVSSETSMYKECKDIMDNWLAEDMRENNGSLDLAYACLNERAKYDINGETKEEYIIDFDGGGVLALIIGIIVLYVIVIFTIQVGVRVIQLAYLQIIAPIPIVMYLTPKGDDTLKKYGTQCMTTFVDFFLRTAIIYFAVMLIKELWGNGNLIGNVLNANLSATGWPALYVKVIMILAILVFAKKVPALLKEIFPSFAGAAAFDYGLSFKKQVVEPLKTAYNSPLGWGLKLGKNMATSAITEYDRKKYNLPKSRNKWQQKLDKLMPGRAEAIKNVTEGAKEVRDIDDKWNDGVKIAKKFTAAGFGLHGSGPNGWDKALDGTTKRNYQIIFNSDEFINSKMTLDKAKKEMERLRDGLLQVQSGGTFTFGGVTYNSSNVANLSDKYNSQSGVVSGLETVHNSLRKQYADDAATEDKFKFVKNNQANPAEPSHTHTTEGI